MYSSEFIDTVDSATVKGTSQALEKSYFRLTSAPDPRTVRPEAVLRKALANLQKKYGSKEWDWSYTSEQFKSIRQDLTVQAINNEFTVHVYEVNANECLLNNDLGQFNQCQTQLRILHMNQNIDVKVRLRQYPIFLCYRILYLTLQKMRLDLIQSMECLTPGDLNLPPVVWALQVRESIALYNYVKYFKLQTQSPDEGCKRIMIMFLTSQRIWALTIMCKSHLLIQISSIFAMLLFKSPLECKEFLQENSAILSRSKNGQVQIECKKSLPYFTNHNSMLSKKQDAMG
eukprot:GHVL01040473.1.p1 GENE.GHVL01040473.1~~GHVL01040473.1.p1  ORF type:complete len:287 (+),score=18.92 GHVL01040473.1:131-991(+)